MDLNNFNLYDDEEARLLSQQKKRKTRKKRSNKKKIWLFVVLVLITTCYFISDFSKVKSIQVRGNIFYYDKDVSEKMNISYDSRYLLTYPSFLYENKLKKDPLIKKVQMKTKLDGTITIDIEEKQVIGYYIDQKTNQLSLLLEDGTSKAIDQDHEKQILKFAYIEGFDQKQMQEIAKAFMEGKEKVSSEILAMISEIRPYSESYDQNMLKIVMQDGNTFYTSLSTLHQMNAYSAVLKDLKNDNVCFVMIPNTDMIQTEDCSAFK